MPENTWIIDADYCGIDGETLPYDRRGVSLPQLRASRHGLGRFGDNRPKNSWSSHTTSTR